ncbi:MAG: hypothetical protein WAX77_11350 [Methylococcaceae bacterium]
MSENPVNSHNTPSLTSRLVKALSKKLGENLIGYLMGLVITTSSVVGTVNVLHEQAKEEMKQTAIAAQNEFTQKIKKITELRKEKIAKQLNEQIAILNEQIIQTTAQLAEQKKKQQSDDTEALAQLPQDTQETKSNSVNNQNSTAKNELDAANKAEAAKNSSIAKSNETKSKSKANNIIAKTNDSKISNTKQNLPTSTIKVEPSIKAVTPTVLAATITAALEQLNNMENPSTSNIYNQLDTVIKLAVIQGIIDDAQASAYKEQLNSVQYHKPIPPSPS